MRIFMTGSTGILGSRVYEVIAGKYEVVRLSRKSGSEIDWTLGEKINLVQINEDDVLLHFAWSLHNRLEDFHLNVGGSFLLASQFRDKGCRVLFISTVAASSNSAYGESKLKAEELMLEMGCHILRLGLVKGGNRYERSMLRFFGFRTNIFVSEFESVIYAIYRFLDGRSSDALQTIVSRIANYQEAVPSSRILLKPRLITIGGRRLYFGIRLIDNLLDSMYSIATTFIVDAENQ